MMMVVGIARRISITIGVVSRERAIIENSAAVAVRQIDLGGDDIGKQRLNDQRKNPKARS